MGADFEGDEGWWKCEGCDAPLYKRGRCPQCGRVQIDKKCDLDQGRDD